MTLKHEYIRLRPILDQTEWLLMRTAASWNYSECAVNCESEQYVLCMILNLYSYWYPLHRT